MSILTVIKDVCLGIGVNPPTSIFTTSIQPRTQAELLSLANEMAQRIAGDTRDWTRLKKTAYLTGDAVFDPLNQIWTGTTAHLLPGDYRRMPITANLWRGPVPLKFIPNTDEWLQRRINNMTPNPSGGEWTIYGGQIHVVPPLRGSVTDPVTLVVTPAEQAAFVYISKYAVELRGPGGELNGFGTDFISDMDTFALDERLLKLGMIWQWKASKGSPYAEDMGTYSDALTTAMGSDSPAPIIVDPRPVPIEGWHANVW